MKDRLFNYVLILDKLSSEISKLVEHLEEITTKIKEGDDETNLVKEYFVYTNYVSLLYMDVSKNIDKLTECYINSLSQGIKLDLTEEEQKVIDKYMKESEEVFVLFEGKIVPKTANLLDIMRERATEMDKQDWFSSYKKTILEK